MGFFATTKMRPSRCPWDVPLDMAWNLEVVLQLSSRRRVKHFYWTNAGGSVFLVRMWWMLVAKRKASQLDQRAWVGLAWLLDEATDRQIRGFSMGGGFNS